MLETLKTRFEKNRPRHPDLSWQQVEARLLGNEKALQTLLRMEESGGEPDVIGQDASGAILCERRCGRVFTFHNGAESYYSVRGWRGILTV